LLLQGESVGSRVPDKWSIDKDNIGYVRFT
jgi:hypothetical protein